MGGAMKTAVGLWIDHAKAVVVTVTDQNVDVKRITSNVDKQSRRTGGALPAAPIKREPRPQDDIHERDYVGHLNVYYDRVILALRDADAVLIFGPGEAKSELKKRMQTAKLDERIVGVESTDKMTDHQIAKKVRQRFQKHWPETV